MTFGAEWGTEASGAVTQTNRKTAHEILDRCHDAGLNFVDTANIYGQPSGRAERILGEWLADHDREDFVIASKVYSPMGGGPNESGLGRKHVREQLEATLERLGTDYLDVYYVHRWDDETPIRETLRTLDEFVHDGRVRYLGASKMAAWKLTKGLWTSESEGLERFEVTQPPYSAASAGAVDEYLDVCAEEGLAVCPYSPLAGGFLTGKYDRETPSGSRADVTDWYDEEFSDRQWQVLEAVRDVAEELDATPAQVSLRWLIERPAFTCVPILGARTPEQIEENLRAADLRLTESQRARIDSAHRGK